MPGSRPIRDNDGRFAGSIGSGITPPTPAPARTRAALEALEQDEAFRNHVLAAWDAWQANQAGTPQPDPEEAAAVHAEWAVSVDDEDSTPTGRRAAPYHKRFTRFHAKTVEATDELFRARPSQLDHDARHAVFTAWTQKVSAAYNMDAPEIRWDTEADYTGGGWYTPADHTITLTPNRPSVTTLIHEFRHAMQAKQAGAPQVDRDVEIDARAWSLSLYHQVRPNLFKRLVQEGRILHIDPNDV